MKLVIEPDDNCESPRDWDNLGIMVCSHRRYDLGDDNPKIDYDNFHSWSDIEYYLATVLDAGVILPLYLYDHSGITMATTPFSCPWDSGQVGFIYASRERIRAEFSVKRISKKLREKVEGILRSEVKDYDQYLTGDVYGYIIEDDNGDELESCWGFCGEDSAREEGEAVMRGMK